MNGTKKYIDYLDQIDGILSQKDLDNTQVKTLKNHLLTQNEIGNEAVLDQLRTLANNIIDELNRQKNTLKDHDEADASMLLKKQQELLDLQYAQQQLKDKIALFYVDKVVRKIVNRLNDELKQNAVKLSEFYNDTDRLKSELKNISTMTVHTSICDQLSLAGYTSTSTETNNLSQSYQRQIHNSVDRVFNHEGNINQSIIQKIITEVLNFLENILPQKLKLPLISYRKDQFLLQLEQTHFPKFNRELRDKLSIAIGEWFNTLNSQEVQTLNSAILQKQQEIKTLQSTTKNEHSTKQDELSHLNSAYKQILSLTENTLY